MLHVFIYAFIFSLHTLKIFKILRNSVLNIFTELGQSNLELFYCFVVNVQKCAQNWALCRQCAQGSAAPRAWHSNNLVQKG